MVDPMEFEIDEPEKVVYVVGIGPGDVYYLTQEARNVLEHADAICGYKLYLDLIEPESIDAKKCRGKTPQMVRQNKFTK